MRHPWMALLLVLGLFVGCATPFGGSESPSPSTSAGDRSPPSATPPITDPGTGNSGNPQSGTLTAGDIDDNLNFDAYLKYLRNLPQTPGGTMLPDVPLGGRVSVRVLDGAGAGVANARVKVFVDGTATPLLESTAGADGRFRFFPAFDGAGNNTGFRVEARPAAADTPVQGIAFDLRTLAANASYEVRLEGHSAAKPQALDLLLVFDTTGSMGDELRYLTTEFQAIVSAVKNQFPGVSMRFSLIAYRDVGDEYVVRTFDFSDNADTIRNQLQAQQAAGGGDYPEAVEQALEQAVKMQWRTGNTSRLVFLVADAPPHDDKLVAALEQGKAARKAGLRFFPLAASGVADTAEYLMRALAVTTHGRYLFLTNDSGVGNPKAEPKIPCYAVTRLDQLIVRVVSSELSGARVEPSKEQVIRTVGKPDAGVCTP